MGIIEHQVAAIIGLENPSAGCTFRQGALVVVVSLVIADSELSPAHIGRITLDRGSGNIEGRGRCRADGSDLAALSLSGECRDDVDVDIVLATGIDAVILYDGDCAIIEIAIFMSGDNICAFFCRGEHTIIDSCAFSN